MKPYHRLVEEARVWASLDGCEGGDFLNALCDALEMSHYTCALGTGDEVKRLLREAIGFEIQGHIKMATGDNSEAFGYDPDEVKEALKYIRSLHG